MNHMTLFWPSQLIDCSASPSPSPSHTKLILMPMQSSKLSSQELANEGTVEVQNDHQLISIVQKGAGEVVQNDQQSASVELLKEGRAEEVRVEIQDGHQSTSIFSSDSHFLQWIKGVTKNLNECQGNRRHHWTSGSIPRVPEDIRKLDMNTYDPSIVTIGPYHYRKVKERRALQAMQDHKWHCVRRLLSRHTKSRRKATNLLAQCLITMKISLASVRNMYSDDLCDLRAEELALIMLLDGCFIIHVFLTSNYGNLNIFFESIESRLRGNNDNEDGAEEKEGIAAGLEEEDMVMMDTVWEQEKTDLQVLKGSKVWDTMLLDLVKVENQIPFSIVEILFDHLKTPRDEDINLVEIAGHLLSPLHPLCSFVTIIGPQTEVDHLLHLFHSTFVPSSDCLEINKINLTKHTMGAEIEWIPNAAELQCAGIEFAEKGSAISFLDISFKNGTIEIPKMNLNGTTSTLFRNLIAFEQSYNLDTQDNYVTAYASFLDYMINTQKDVELLELKGIFNNHLGSPDQAATLINQLCHHIRDRSNSYLQGSIQEVHFYYKSKWHKWRAGLIHDYFSNPWTTLSLVAAIILLLLTFQQSFFSAYSYFRPPKA